MISRKILRPSAVLQRLRAGRRWRKAVKQLQNRLHGSRERKVREEIAKVSKRTRKRKNATGRMFPVEPAAKSSEPADRKTRVRGTMRFRAQTPWRRKPRCISWVPPSLSPPPSPPALHGSINDGPTGTEVSFGPFRKRRAGNKGELDLTAKTPARIFLPSCRSEALLCLLFGREDVFWRSVRPPDKWNRFA